MARSQLLKDAASTENKLDSILYRLKIILNDLENPNISKWVNSELEGYADDDLLPPYRDLQGRIMGTYIVNRSVQHTNSQVPLLHLLSLDEVQDLEKVRFTTEISTVERTLESEEGKLASPIPTDYCYSISTPSLQILSMHTELNKTQLSQLISKVRSKLIEIILELEKNFERIDDLDIRHQLETKDIDKRSVVINIEKIIYEGSLEIGDGNKISKSTIGRWLRKGEN